MLAGLPVSASELHCGDMTLGLLVFSFSSIKQIQKVCPNYHFLLALSY